LPPMMSPTTRHVMNTATSVMNRLRRASNFTRGLWHGAEMLCADQSPCHDLRR
jgi:hypothetical protein